jgi:hypothetical protein
MLSGSKTGFTTLSESTTTGESAIVGAASVLARGIERAELEARRCKKKQM